MTESTTATPTTAAPTVLVVGASGDLGGRIARELATAGARTRLLLRGGTDHPAASELVASTGGEVVAGDLADPDPLAAAVDGIEVIVSAVQGGPDVIIAGQTALANAGQAAGARRIFPSDFSIDFTTIPPEEHLFLGWRAEAQDAIAASGMAQTNTYNGAFMRMLLPQDMLTLVDWNAGAVRYWGDSHQRYDFTTMDDVARYVAAAALDDTPPDGAFRIAGDSRSPAELVQVISRRTGREFALVPEGTLDDLVAELGQRQAAAPKDPMQWAGLQYLRAMVSGTGALTSLDVDRYPAITPTTVESFLDAMEDPSPNRNR